VPDKPELELDRAFVRALSGLCRLHLTDAAEASAQQRLAAVLQAFSALRAVDLGQDGDGENVAAGVPLRPDLPEPVLSQEQVLANASQKLGGAFLVPRVIEG